jgi:hypothetical protein
MRLKVAQILYSLLLAITLMSALIRSYSRQFGVKVIRAGVRPT